MSKNIEMNYYNGSDYEILYPSVMMNNIGDWQSNVIEVSQNVLKEYNSWNKFKETELVYNNTEFSNSSGDDNIENASKELVNGNYLTSNEDIALVINGEVNLQLVDIDSWFGVVLRVYINKNNYSTIIEQKLDTYNSTYKIKYNNQFLVSNIFTGNFWFDNSKKFSDSYIFYQLPHDDTFLLNKQLFNNGPISIGFNNYTASGENVKIKITCDLTLIMYKHPSILGMYLSQ